MTRLKAGLLTLLMASAVGAVLYAQGIRIEPGGLRVQGVTTLVGGLAVQHPTDVPRFFAVPSGPGVRIVGRTSDSIGGLQFMDTSQATEYLNINARSTGTFFETGSTTRPFTFTGGRINSGAAQPGFLARKTSVSTGVNALANITFETEDYDETSNFGSNTTFTAPAAGRYLFTAGVSATNTTGSAGLLEARITATGAREFSIGRIELANTKDVVLAGSVVVNLAASDAVTVVYIGANGVSINTGSYFSGRLLP